MLPPPHVDPRMRRIVTLTTDFGSGSHYVAELKGRLLHGPEATLVDIDHDVPAHDRCAAAWLVAAACPAFPAGTLHIVVVDPGVGTARRLVWVRSGGQEYLAPDNGVLTLAIRRGGLAEARVIPVDDHAAATFHGRDVLAPLAGRLLAGDAADTIGPRIESLETLAWPEPVVTAAGIRGEVVHVDAFGTLVTNLPATLWPRILAAGGLRVGGERITRLVRTYGDAPRDSLVVLVGSQGFIEAAVVEGRADRRLAVGRGAFVEAP